MTTYAERQGWTFDKRLLRPNTERRTCGHANSPGCGKVHDYYTRGCIPVLSPDQWEGEDDYVSAPEDMDISNFPRQGDDEIREEVKV